MIGMIRINLENSTCTDKISLLIFCFLLGMKKKILINNNNNNNNNNSLFAPITVIHLFVCVYECYNNTNNTNTNNTTNNNT